MVLLSPARTYTANSAALRLIPHSFSLLLTAPQANIGGKPPRCCDGKGEIQTVCRHRDCFPIDLAADDPVFGSQGRRCLEFLRSLPAPQAGGRCRLGPREQINDITSYLDASNVYGSSERMARNLRALEGGRMRLSTSRAAHRDFGIKTRVGSVGRKH